MDGTEMGIRFGCTIAGIGLVRSAVVLPNRLYYPFAMCLKVGPEVEDVYDRTNLAHLRPWYLTELSLRRNP